jgi:hypothetical protein
LPARTSSGSPVSAQPLERGAHRRLRGLQFQRGTGYAAFGDQGVEHADEGQLDLVEIGAFLHTGSDIAAISVIVYTWR